MPTLNYCCKKKLEADKGSYVVVWDHEDYIAEAERQLGDVTVYKDVNFKEKNVARSCRN